MKPGRGRHRFCSLPECFSASPLCQSPPPDMTRSCGSTKLTIFPPAAEINREGLSLPPKLSGVHFSRSGVFPKRGYHRASLLPWGLASQAASHLERKADSGQQTFGSGSQALNLTAVFLPSSLSCFIILGSALKLTKLSPCLGACHPWGSHELQLSRVSSSCPCPGLVTTTGLGNFQTQSKPKSGL